MRHTITVLQDDIDNGITKDAHRCAVARAFQRELSEVVAVSVGQRNVTVYRTAPEQADIVVDAAYGDLPDEATRFIRAFDKGRPVEPFKFEVELP